MLLFTFGLLAVLIGLLYVYLTWNNGYWSKRNVYDVGATLVAGSFPRAFLQQQNIVYGANEEYKKHRGHKPYIGTYASRTPNLMMIDPEYIKTVMTTDFKKFHDNDIGITIDKQSDPLLARNPFMLTGDEWRDKRAEITPAFTSSKLKTMYPIMQHVCTKLTSHVHDELATQPNGFDAKELASKFTADVVANCIFGIDSGALSGRRSVMREMAAIMFGDNTTTSIIYFAVIQVMPWINCIYRTPITPTRVVRFFEQLTCDAICQRLENGVKRDDFLGYLQQLNARKPMSDIEMTAHTMTFFSDGVETSSLVIAMALMYLGQNRAVQDRLRTEIDAALMASTADIDMPYDALTAMPFLDQVVYETLRISPAIGFLTRLCTETNELRDYDGRMVTIEKGTPIQIPIYSIHHDADWYPDPEIFDPDRFSPDNGGVKKFRDLGVFLGFGDGPRMCLGMRFALTQVKSALVEIVRKFEVSLNTKMQLPIVYDPKNFMLTPLGGIWVDFEPRKKDN